MSTTEHDQTGALTFLCELVSHSGVLAVPMSALPSPDAATLTMTHAPEAGADLTVSLPDGSHLMVRLEWPAADDLAGALVPWHRQPGEDQGD